METNNSALKTICGLIEKVSLRDAEIEVLRSFKDRYIVLQDINCELSNTNATQQEEIITLEDKNKSQRIDLEKLMNADEVVCENKNVNFVEYDFNNLYRNANYTNPIEYINSLTEKNNDLIYDNNKLRAIRDDSLLEIRTLREYNEDLRESKDVLMNEIVTLTSGIDEFIEKLKNADCENEKPKAHNIEIGDLLQSSLKEKCDIWKWSDMHRGIIEGMKDKNTMCDTLVELIREYIEAGNSVSDEIHIAFRGIETIIPVSQSSFPRKSYVFKQLQNQVFERMNQHYIYLNCTSLEGLPAALDYLGKEDMFELEILGGVVDKYKIPRELIECSQDEFNKRFTKLQTCK